MFKRQLIVLIFIIYKLFHEVFVFYIFFISNLNKKKIMKHYSLGNKDREKVTLRLQKVKIYFNIEDFNNKELLNWI